MKCKLIKCILIVTTFAVFLDCIIYCKVRWGRYFCKFEVFGCSYKKFLKILYSEFKISKSSVAVVCKKYFKSSSDKNLKTHTGSIIEQKTQQWNNWWHTSQFINFFPQSLKLLFLINFCKNCFNQQCLILVLIK